MEALSNTGVTPRNIKVLRRRMGWTQEQLARHLGVSRNTVARWEITRRDGTAMHEPRGNVRVVLRRLLGRQGLLERARWYPDAYGVGGDDIPTASGTATAGRDDTGPATGADGGG